MKLTSSDFSGLFREIVDSSVVPSFDDDRGGVSEKQTVNSANS
jgi:hypothetical protein